MESWAASIEVTANLMARGGRRRGGSHTLEKKNKKGGRCCMLLGLLGGLVGPRARAGFGPVSTFFLFFLFILLLFSSLFCIFCILTTKEFK
jgi:hypothetical protein